MRTRAMVAATGVSEPGDWIWKRRGAVLGAVVALVGCSAPGPAGADQGARATSTAEQLGSSPTPVGAATDVRSRGARCDGVTDDGPAFQAAVDATPAGGAVSFPGGCLIKSTVNIAKPLTLQGGGLGAGLHVPAVTAFKITARFVRLTNFFVYGDRSNDPENRLFDAPMGTGSLYVDHVRAERLNTIGSVDGGAFYHFTSISARNLVRAGFILDGFRNLNGNDAFFDQDTYDTDTGVPEPELAFIWCRDFDAIVIGPSNDFLHAGQIAVLYINPRVRGSGNHLIGAAYFDSTQGAGVAVRPEGTAVVNRLFIDGAWFGTVHDGIYFTGNNDIIDVQVRNAKFQRNFCSGVRWDNASKSKLPTSLLIQGSVFAGNNNGGGACDDIAFLPADHGQLKVFNNTFGNYFLWPGVPAANVNVGANAQSAKIAWNDFSDSNARLKIRAAAPNGVVAESNLGLQERVRQR